MADERRRNLLDAAARIVGRSGVEALTMEGLAKEAGVSRALPYRYFPNATKVVITLAEEEWAWVDNEIALGLAAAESYEDKILAGLRPYFDGLATRGPAFPILMIVPQSFEPLAELHHQRIGEIVSFWTEMGVTNLGVDEETAHAVAAILLEASIGALKMAWLENKEREHLERVLMQIIRASVRDFRRTARERAPAQRDHSRKPEKSTKEGSGTAPVSASAKKGRKDSESL